MVVFDVFLLSFCQQIASFCYKASKRKYVYAHKRIDVGTRRAALLEWEMLIPVARLGRFLSPFHYESGPLVRLQSEVGKERGTPHPYICKVKFYIALGIYLLHLEILSKASAVRSCVPKAVKRTYPSPLGPKPQPGVQTTCAP